MTRSRVAEGDRVRWAGRGSGVVRLGGGAERALVVGSGAGAGEEEDEVRGAEDGHHQAGR